MIKLTKSDKQKIKVNITNLNGDPLKLKDTVVIVYDLNKLIEFTGKRSWEKPDKIHNVERMNLLHHFHMMYIMMKIIFQNGSRDKDL